MLIRITWSDCAIGDESVGIECKYSRDVVDRGGKSKIEPYGSRASSQIDPASGAEEGTSLSVIAPAPAASESNTLVSHIASARFTK
jgi:hypothetical protein